MPGLDGIPNRTLKLAMKSRVDIFAELSELRMFEGIFRAVWKRQKLILLPKATFVFKTLLVKF